MILVLHRKIEADEFFFECAEEDLEEFYEKRAQKVAKVKTVGKILDHMDEEQEVFPVSFLLRDWELVIFGEIFGGNFQKNFRFKNFFRIHKQRVQQI